MAAQKPITPADTFAAKSDLFADRLGNAEPSLEAILKWGRPFTGKAVIGLPFGKKEVCVTPEGAILAPLPNGKRLWLRATEEGKALFNSQGRVLTLPTTAVEHRVVRGGLTWDQRVYVAPIGAVDGALVVQLQCHFFPKGGLAIPHFEIAVIDPPANLWQDPAQVPKPASADLVQAEDSIALPGNVSLHARWWLSTIAPKGSATLGLRRSGSGDSWHQFDLELAPMVMLQEGSPVNWLLYLPLSAEAFSVPKGTPYRHESATATTWSSLLKPVPQYTVPEPVFQDLVPKLLAQLLITAEGDQMVYGAFPSAYDNGFFGPEEGWATLALAEWGLKDVAERLFRGTFLTKEFIDKSDRHHQYRNGNLGYYAWWIYQRTGDKRFLEECLPHMQAAALWTMDQTARDEFGLLPKYNYGGDIGQPARALWPNVCCWRGLRDTQLALDALGYPNTGVHQEAANAYGKRIREAFGAAKGREKGFYPLSLEETRTTLPSPEYYQLFAPMILENGLFEPDSPEFKDMEKFMQSTGRIQCGVPRFSPDKVAGIDAEYGYGRLITLLRKGDRRGFLLGVYGQIGLSMDPVYGTSPEVTPLLLDDAAMKNQQAEQEEHWGRSTEPCSAGVGVTLLYLRRMLAFEEMDRNDIPNGTLQLLPAVPERWWKSKKPWGVKGLPTSFGKLDLSVTPVKGKVKVTVSIKGPGPEKLKALALRVPPTTSNKKEWGWVKVAHKGGKATMEVSLRSR